MFVPSIIKIRVERDRVSNFPFDVVYIVPTDQRAVLPKLFPWSLCIPITKDIYLALCPIILHQVEQRPHEGRAVVDEEWRARSMKTFRSSRFEYNVIGKFMVVPILPLMTNEEAKKEHYKLPSYLMAKPHRTIKRDKRGNELPRRFSEFMHDAVVLFTPDGPFRPVCLKCRRHLLHMQGKCTLGEPACYDELILKRNAYAVPRGNEDEQLQTNDTDSPSDTAASAE